MYDPAFTPRTIEPHVRRSDRARRPELKDPLFHSETLKRSAQFAHNYELDLDPHIVRSKVSGKTINAVKSIEIELILRKLNSNLRSCFGARNPQRHNLVRCLCEILRDDCAYSLYRYDIKSFYESVSDAKILEDLAALDSLSGASRRLVGAFVRWHKKGGGVGLPRGFSISASLADFCLKGFDEEIKAATEVFFYSRYADDILIVAAPEFGKKAARRLVARSLPTGLTLNESKTISVKLPKLSLKVPAKDGAKVLEVEYLGYEISVFNPMPTEEARVIKIGIAKGKIKKIKKRVALSFLDYCKTRDFPLLRKRISFLTGNYSLVDKNRRYMRLAGIYYNYPLVNELRTVQELDKFLKAAVLSSHGPIFSRSSNLLSMSQKRDLMRSTFTAGFSRRLMRDFSPALVQEIQGCWKYAR